MLIPGAGPQKPAGAAREGAADFLSVLAGAAGGDGGSARAGTRAPGVDGARSDAAGVKTETPENPDAEAGAALTSEAGLDEAITKDAMAKEAAGRRDGEGAATDPDITLAQAVTASTPSTPEAGARVDAADPAQAREPKSQPKAVDGASAAASTPSAEASGATGPAAAAQTSSPATPAPQSGPAPQPTAADDGAPASDVAAAAAKAQPGAKAGESAPERSPIPNKGADGAELRPSSNRADTAVNAVEAARAQGARLTGAGQEGAAVKSAEPAGGAGKVADEPSLAGPELTAAMKRTGAEAAQDGALRAGRGGADAVLARTPGELVRAAGQESRSPSVKRAAEGAAKADAAAPGGAVSKAAAPGPVPPSSPNFAIHGFDALMAAAGRPALEAAIAAEAGAAETSQVDLELTLDQAVARSEGRVEAQRAALPTAANAHAAARFQPQTVGQLAARIAAKAVDGARVFDIRMDPAELGRVEVRLELGDNNSVRALLSAERSETLAELQRSARDLEKALAEAGLDLAEDGLSFSLSDDGAGFGDGADGEPAFAAPADAAGDSAGHSSADAALAPVRFYGFDLAARRGLDVRI